MSTVGDVVDRAGLLPLTPGSAEKSRKCQVSGLATVPRAARVRMESGSLAYISTRVWSAVASVALLPGELRSAGAVAVVIDNDDANLSPEFVAGCVQVSLPIYMLPKSLAIADLGAAISAQTLPLDDRLPVADHVTAMVATLEAFSAGTGMLVSLVMDGCVLSSTPEMDFELLTKALALVPTPLSGISSKSAAIHLVLPVTGYQVAVVNSRRASVDRGRVQHLAAQLDGQAKQILLQRGTRQRLEAALIRELIEAQLPSAALDPWVGSFGLAAGDRVRAVAVILEQVPADQVGGVVSALHDLGVVSGSECVASTHLDIAYALIKTGGEEPRNPVAKNSFDHHLKSFTDLFAHQRDTTLAVGVSSYVIRSSDDLLRGLINARQLAERQARSPAADELDIELSPSLAAALLAADPKMSESLERALLQPVLDYDAEKGTSYVATLRTFLALDGHWGATANELGIHSNTLRYRLSRVERLTGRGMQSTADRSDYYLALCLRDSTRLEQPPAP